MAMKEILRNVILNGGLPLTQVADRIDVMFVNGRITSSERDELVELMHRQAQAKPENEKGGWEARCDALAAMLAEQAAQMAALAARLDALDGGTGAGGTDAAIPEWRAWDGVSRDYQQGAVVMHNGKYWRSMLAGQNVWEPGAVGVDERYWVEISKNDAQDSLTVE